MRQLYWYRSQSEEYSQGRQNLNPKAPTTYIHTGVGHCRVWAVELLDSHRAKLTDGYKALVGPVLHQQAAPVGADDAYVQYDALFLKLSQAVPVDGGLAARGQGVSCFTLDTATAASKR